MQEHRCYQDSNIIYYVRQGKAGRYVKLFTTYAIFKNRCRGFLPDDDYWAWRYTGSGHKKLPWRETFDEAQADLDAWAVRKGLDERR